MAKKYYAIKKGRDNKKLVDVKDVIVTTWDECLLYVKGVKGAIYKSFTSREEAVTYLSNNSFKKGEDEYPEDIPHIYVDGSYNISTKEYGYGVVIVHNDIIIHAAYGKGYNEECNQRQVNGELQAALSGVEFAANQNYDRVVLFYDYAGVCQHATGNWERNNSLSMEYYDKMSDFMEKHLEIIFVKVDSHTGDLYNDMADELAKFGAGVTVDGVTSRAVKKKKICLGSKEIKDILLNIINDGENISIKGEETEVKNETEVKKETEIKKETISDKNMNLSHIKNLSQVEREKFLNKLKKEELKSLIHELVKMI